MRGGLDGPWPMISKVRPAPQIRGSKRPSLAWRERPPPALTVQPFITVIFTRTFSFYSCSKIRRLSLEWGVDFSICSIVADS
jgi:hypothetical protein